MATILAATDFSASSRTAIRLAVGLARRQSASLALLHVVEPPPVDVPSAPIGATAWEAELLATAEIDLARLADELRQSDIAVETRVVLGSPVRTILEISRQVGAALIVIGAHGRKGAAHLLIGSVAERVVREATVPVLVTNERAVVPSRWDGPASLALAIVSDGTKASRAAIYWTRTSGESLRGTVSLVRPYWPPQEAARYGVDEPWPGEKGHAELLRLIERDTRLDARALSGAHEAPIRFRVVARDAPEGLSEDAADLRADALVIGVPKHAKSEGPISVRSILRTASLPVFCIPEAMRPADDQIAPVRSILLACDLSESSKKAILPSYGLLYGGGRVELCYVHPLGRTDVLGGGPEMSELAPGERAGIEGELHAAIPPGAAEHGIATHVSVIEAPFVDEAIAAAAERLDVDLVVVGSHGRSGLSRVVLGSIAEQVARRSRRPVLIVRTQPTSA